MTKEETLFQKGMDAFNKRKFYDAHEYWEELWLDYQLNDAMFIQGLRETIKKVIRCFQLITTLGQSLEEKVQFICIAIH